MSDHEAGQERRTAAQLRAAAVSTALASVEDEFVRRGVERIRALDFIEHHVQAVIVPGTLHVHLELPELHGYLGVASRGGSLAHHRWFARQAHRFHRDTLGGTPTFDRDDAPEPEHITQKREADARASAGRHEAWEQQRERELAHRRAAEMAIEAQHATETERYAHARRF